MARKIFYSFDYNKDLFRVQQIRNIGVFDNSKPVSPNRWEQIKQGGDDAIREWIDKSMIGRTCLVVLIGERTYQRRWVKYEIQKAWQEGKGVLGVYIHNLNCMRDGYCSKGNNPFDYFTIGEKRLSSIVKCYNPSSEHAYSSIKENLEKWVEIAISIRDNI